MTVEILSDIWAIKEKAFFGCTNLKNFQFNDKIQFIESSSFYGCKSLTNIKIPDNIIQIREYAFKDCINITEIIFPQKMKIFKFLAMLLKAAQVLLMLLLTI